MSTRIGFRLSAAFAVVLAMLVALVGVSQLGMRRMSAQVHDIAETRLQNLALATEVVVQGDVTARKLSFLLSADATARRAAYAEIALANHRLDVAMERLSTRLTESDSQLRYQAVQARLIDYREAFGATVEYIEQGELEAARRSMVTDTDDTLGRLAEACAELASQEQRLTRTSAESLDLQLRQRRRFEVLLCLVGLLIGSALAYVVTASIVRPLRRTEATALRLVEGDYDARVDISTRDKVGRVSAALNTLAATIGERENSIQHLANTDVLTGLAQRPRFVEDAARLLHSLRPGAHAAMMCFDVDRLKTINATLGFEAGDAVILSAAQRLSAMLGPQTCLSRLGGGTFAVLACLDGRHDGQGLTTSLRREVEHKVAWAGHALDLSITAGLANYPEQATDAELLLRQAEQALFEAKRIRSGFVVYSSTLEASRVSHLSLLSDLQEAIELGQLRQFLQPKLTPNGMLKGAEALIRWFHPQRGWVPPIEFITFAERTGRIGALTDWMLERAVQTLARWQAESIELTIAVNVSTRDIQDLTLPSRIAALLERYEVAPERLQIELTETGLMQSGRDPIEVLASLRELGVWLAVDDFGTGQSSLAYLQQLPMQELKIDRCFVSNVDADADRSEFLSSIVRLGHSLGLSVTAEGVETQAELEVAARAGCDLVQGYVLALPMDTPAFEAWREAMPHPQARATAEA